MSIHNKKMSNLVANVNYETMMNLWSSLLTYVQDEKNMGDIFKVTNRSVLLVIAPMILFPLSRFTNFVLRSKTVLLTLSLIYTFLIAVVMMNSSTKIDFSSFDSVASGFGRKSFVLVGWIHYLVTDPLVGTLIYYDALSRGIPHLITGPIIFLTLMLCPAGLALYLFLRLILCRVWFEWFQVPSEEVTQNTGFFAIWFGSSQFWRNLFCMSAKSSKKKDE